MGERLKQEGIRFGVNIASLVGHTDMEVPEEYRLGFQKWVDESGKEAHACYCIQDEAWAGLRGGGPAGCMPLPDRNAFSWTTISEV